MSNEALAKALFEAWSKEVFLWDTLPDEGKEDWYAVERAARAYFALSDDAVPGCVSKLVNAVRAAQRFLAGNEAQAAFTLQGVHGGCESWREEGQTIGEILAEAISMVSEV